MGKVTGFLEIDRRDRRYPPASDRIRHYREFVIPLSEEATRDQAARCMNCGIPVLSHRLPGEQPDPRLERSRLSRRLARGARATCIRPTIFPSSPAASARRRARRPARSTSIETPVTIKTIECAIVDRGWEEGWIEPEPPTRKTGKKVAVVGSGPAGMACAQQLARAGHDVHLFEKYAKPAACCATASPTSRWRSIHVERRVEQMEAEGVMFHCSVTCRRRPGGERSLDRLRRGGAGRRRREAARPADPGPRSRRRPFRDGFPAAAEPPRRAASRS